MHSDEAPFRSQLICCNQPAICRANPTCLFQQISLDPWGPSSLFLSLPLCYLLFLPPHFPPPPFFSQSPTPSLSAFFLAPIFPMGAKAHGDLGWGPADFLTAKCCKIGFLFPTKGEMEGERQTDRNRKSRINVREEDRKRH